MALTPLDIHHKEFKTARFGGYNEEEVDSFLDMIAEELEGITQENNELRLQLEHLKQRLAEFEEMQSSLQSALLAATRSAEAVKEQARQESENILLKTQKEADLLIGNADEQARQVQLQANEEKQKLEREFARLREMKKQYLQSIKKIAETHLAQVSDLESKEEKGAAVRELPFDAQKPAEPKAAAPEKQREKASPPAVSTRRPESRVEEAPLPKIQSKPETAAEPQAPRPPAFVEDMPVAEVKQAPAPGSEDTAPQPERQPETPPETGPQDSSPDSPPETGATPRVVVAPEFETAARPTMPRTDAPFATELEAVAPQHGNMNVAPAAVAVEMERTVPTPVPRAETPASVPEPLAEAPAAVEVAATPATTDQAARRQPIAQEIPEAPVAEQPPRAAPRQEMAAAAPAEASPSSVETAGSAAAPASSNLVQEVLAVDMEEDIYSLLEDEGANETRGRGRRGRRDKREKHFFWE